MTDETPSQGLRACPRYRTRGGGDIPKPCANCDCRFHELSRAPIASIPEPVDARERQLQTIGDVIEHWIGSVTAERDAEGLTTDADTHVMFGYSGAPPHWPSVGQLKAWLGALRAIPEPDMRGDVVERIRIAADNVVSCGCCDDELRELNAAIDAACPRHE